MFPCRYAEHYADGGKQSRTLIKAYGIRFIVSVQGRAGKFDVVPLLQNIGSGLAVLSIVSTSLVLSLFCAFYLLTLEILFEVMFSLF